MNQAECTHSYVNDTLLDLFLGAIYDSLTGRDLEVICLRYGFHDGNFHTLQSTGDIFGVSRERIRQLEHRSLKKLKYKALKQFKNQEINGDCCKLIKHLNDVISPYEDGDLIKIVNFTLEIADLPHQNTISLITKLLYKEKSIRKSKEKNANELVSKAHQLRRKQELLKTQKENAYKQISDQIIWPQITQCVNLEIIKQLKPNRKVNEYSLGETGSFYSEKLTRNVEYESKLEMDLYQRLEYIDQVKFYIEQPFEIEYQRNGIKRSYFPDLFLILDDNRGVVVEIKPRVYMALFDNLPKWTALKEFCERNGYGYIISDGYRNIRKLLNRQVSPTFKEKVLSILNTKDIYWKEYQQLHQEYGVSWDDFTSFVLQYNIKWTLYPFKLYRGKYSLEA